MTMPEIIVANQRFMTADLKRRKAIIASLIKNL